MKRVTLVVLLLLYGGSARSAPQMLLASPTPFVTVSAATADKLPQLDSQTVQRFQAKAPSVGLPNAYFKFGRTSDPARGVLGQPTRTAAYGPVRTVVSQRSVGNRRTYADLKAVAFATARVDCPVLPWARPTTGRRRAINAAHYW